MRIQQHDGVVVEATVISAELRQALGDEGVSREGEGEARGLGAAALPPPTIYRPSGGRRPWIPSTRGAAARGVECPPRQVEAPPTLGFPILGAGGAQGGAHQPTRGWSPPHFSPRGLPR